DPELVNALRVSRSFDRAELVLDETEPDPEVLTEVRKFLMRLAKKRGLDETPAALSEAAGELAAAGPAQARAVRLWAGGAQMPLPEAFTAGEDAWRQVLSLTNPLPRVNEVHAARATLEAGHKAIEAHAAFQQQHGTPFTELAGLVGQFQAVEHLLEP